MQLKELQKHWDALGKQDPLWAILSDPEKMHGKWDLNEFFKTGVDQVALLLQYIDALRLPLARGKALDFGCGVGRVTQALAQHFAEVHGIDISPSMLEQARCYNRFGDRCKYHLNSTNDLRLFPANSFDLVFTFQVLQHMRPEYSRRYIQEFLRVLRPGGLLHVQIPSGLADAAPAPQPEDDHPLPDEAFRAHLYPHRAALVAEPGCRTAVWASVQNLSAVSWPPSAAGTGRYAVLLANRWLDAAGNVLVQDDGRVGLPKALNPGEEAALCLRVNTPAQPGSYLLELDMLQDSVAWFQEKGSAPVQIPVTIERTDVSPGSEPPAEETAALTPQIEMYGTPKEEVLDLVARAGCKIAALEESLDQDWISYTYLIRK